MTRYKRYAISISVPEPLLQALARDADNTGENLSTTAVRTMARGYGMDAEQLVVGCRKKRVTSVISAVAHEQNLTAELPWPTSLYDLEKHPHRSRTDYNMLAGRNGNWLRDGAIIELTELERSRVRDLAEIYAY